MKLKLDHDGVLEISGAGAQGDTVLREPLAAVIGQLFAIMGAELCLTRDGCAALQFDTAPDVTIGALVDQNAIHCQTLDVLVDALIAEINAAPDEEDRTDLIAFRTRLQYALSEVDGALARINDAGEG